MQATSTAVFSHGQLPGSLELAFVGDSVYDLYVRTALARTGGRVRDLHAQAIKLVNARAQCEAYARVEPLFTEAEAGIARRARNAKQSPTKSAGAREYHLATALEAVLGYLYLTGQTERLNEMLRLCADMGGQ